MIREMERVFEEMKDDFRKRVNTSSFFKLFAQNDYGKEETKNNETSNEESSNLGSKTNSYEDISLQDIEQIKTENTDEIASIEEENVSVNLLDEHIDNDLVEVKDPPDVIQNFAEATLSDKLQLEQAKLEEIVETIDPLADNIEEIENPQISNQSSINEVAETKPTSSHRSDSVIEVVVEDFTNTTLDNNHNSFTVEEISENDANAIDLSNYCTDDKESQDTVDATYPTKPSNKIPLKSREEFRGNLNRRMGWSQMPEVQASGCLSKLTKREIQLEEAMFEIITTEAAYYASLMVLTEHFLNSDFFKNSVSPMDNHHIFSNIVYIMKTSLSLLLDLEDRWNEQKPLLRQNCDILLKHASSQQFQHYVTYLRNQQYQIEALKRITENDVFYSQLKRLENTPECAKLSLDSYLMLPMQRLTRLRLLVENILKIVNCDELKSKIEPDFISNAEASLVEIKKLLNASEFEKNVMDQKTIILSLINKLEFPSEIKCLTFSDKTFVKEETLKVHSSTNIKTLRKITKKKQIALTLHLFTDLIIITKKKGNKYRVIDYTSRENIIINPLNSSASINDLAFSSVKPGDNSIDIEQQTQHQVSLSAHSSVNRTASIHSTVSRSKTTLSGGSNSSNEDRSRRMANPLASSLKSLPYANENEVRNFLFSLEFDKSQTDIFSSPVVFACVNANSKDQWVRQLSKRGSLCKDSTRLQKSLSLNVKSSDADQYHRKPKYSFISKNTDA